MLLFIGSTVADVVVRLPSLPRTGDDLHVLSQQVSLGGCAYNAFRAARLLGAEARLFSSVGGGVWGDFVARALAQEGIDTGLTAQGDNGCCYCLVEPSGERTFLCDHGAEYVFRKEWFNALTEDFPAVYVCGLEIEEPTGAVILDYLETRTPPRLYFAPGPRLCAIAPDRMERLLALHPVLHLNDAEALQFTHTDTVEAAAQALHALTGNDVIITLGAEGAFIHTADNQVLIPGMPARVVDTIGAGDAHIGAIMASEAAGMPLAEAVRYAHRLSAAVVSYSGATLPTDAWNAWTASHPLF